MREEPQKTTHFYLGVATGQLIGVVGAIGGNQPFLPRPRSASSRPLSTGTCMELLGDDSLPMFMATCTYLLLLCIPGFWLVKHRGFRLSSPWWKYALLALLDVAAAYFTLLSLRYTTVTSWALMQPASLIAVVPLSVFLLDASYTWRHLGSGLLAVSGLVLLLLSDVQSEDDEVKHSAAVRISGDLCALLGTSLYGTNGVLVEKVIKGNVPQYEVLSMMGGFGFVYGILAALSFGEISGHMFPSRTVPAYMAVAVAASFGFYLLGIVVLQHSGAAVLQISLLSTNFWSVVGKIFILGGFHTNVIGFFFALFLVVSGVTLFTLSGDPYAKHAIRYTALESEMSRTATPPR